MTIGLSVFAAIVLVSFLGLFACLRIIPEYERAVHFRLGHLRGAVASADHVGPRGEGT